MLGLYSERSISMWMSIEKIFKWGVEVLLETKGFGIDVCGSLKHALAGAQDIGVLGF